MTPTPPSLPFVVADAGGVILFVLFLVGGLLNYLFKKGGPVETLKRAGTPTARPPSPPPAGSTRPAPLSPTTNPEELRVRKLLEALGQTGRPGTTTLPPFPGTARNSSPSPRRPPPIPPPVVTRQLPPPLPEPPSPPLPALVEAKQARVARTARTSPVPRVAGRSADGMRALLRGPAGQLRQAILLKEVLGPPRGLSERGDPVY